MTILNGTLNGSITEKQKKAAHELLAKRPMVVPGTRAIIEEDRAKAWHDEVSAVITGFRLNPAQVMTFCDEAGVAD